MRPLIENEFDGLRIFENVLLEQKAVNVVQIH